MENKEKKTNIFILKDCFDGEYDYIFTIDKKLTSKEIKNVIEKANKRYEIEEYDNCLLSYIEEILKEKKIKYKYCKLSEFNFAFYY